MSAGSANNRRYCGLGIVGGPATSRSKTVGLQPQGFTWVIAGRLAVSERIGGSGMQHRRVRRDEELSWLREHGFNTLLSVLDETFNVTAYEQSAMRVLHIPVRGELEDHEAVQVLEGVVRALEHANSVALLHSDSVTDGILGVLGAYLLRSGLIADPIMAIATIQEIMGRPIGPTGRKYLLAAAR